jgi:hypothetical protein
MRGTDFCVLMVEALYERVRGLSASKKLIGLGLCTLLIALPVGWARSHGGLATTPASQFDDTQSRPPGAFDTGRELVLYGRSEPDKQVLQAKSPAQPATPAADPILQAWNHLPTNLGAQSGRALPSAADSDAPVESFTTYPSPARYEASSTVAERQQIVEEIQRRLARMKATSGVFDSALPSQVPQTADSTPKPAAMNHPLGLDGDTSLPLFQPVAQSAPMPAPKPAPPATESQPVVAKDMEVVQLKPIVGRPDPSFGASPAAVAAFNRNCETAKLRMQQGQYRRAADSYTDALTYRPNDCGAYQGKAHALLAAGQYPGSAAALAKAVTLDASAALKKVDLVRIVGGADEFLARCNELIKRVRENPTPDQNFLLAYIYYQMDQLPDAKTAIEAAASGSFSPTAVENLRAAIAH